MKMWTSGCKHVKYENYEQPKICIFFSHIFT